METTLLITAAKATAWFAIVFVLLPARIFGRPTEGSLGQRILVGMARMAAATIVLVHLLALLGILDAVSLYVSYGLLGVGVFRLRVGRFPGRELRSLTFQTQRVVFDVLDYASGYWDVPVSEVRARVVARVRRSAGTAFAVAREHAALAVVLAGVAWVHWPRLAAGPAPLSLADHEHILRLKTLAAGSLFGDGGYYPLGTQALALLLRNLAVADEVLLWRGLPLVLSVAAAALVYGATLRFAPPSGRPRLSAATASALAGIGVLSPVAGGGEAALAAVPFLLGALLLVLLASLRARPTVAASPVSRAAQIALLFALAFVHPLAWVVAVVLIASAWLLEVALEVRRDKVPLRDLVLGGLSIFPAAAIGIGAFFATGLASGALDLFADVRYGGADPHPLSLAEAPLLLAAGAGAIAVFLLPAAEPDELEGRRIRDLRALAVGFLVVWAALGMPRYGLPQVVDPVSLHILLVPVAALVLGAALAHAFGIVPLRARTYLAARTPRAAHGALSVGILALIILLSPPRVRGANVALEPRIAVELAHRIKGELTNHEWTLVGHPELQTHVRGEGWAITRREFLERYRPETYQWDPDVPEQTVPTRHTLFFIEKGTLVVPAVPGTSILERADENRRLMTWLTLYMLDRGRLEIFFEDEELIVLHHFRSVAEEREVLQRKWEEKKAKK